MEQATIRKIDRSAGLTINPELSRRIEKIVVNAGVGRLTSQPGFPEKILPELIKDLALITGQKPASRPAKRSISSFKLREGQVIGLKATLRGKRMMYFLEKLIRAVLPRIRDFRGLNLTSIDEHGNLTIGIRDNIVFPEINPEATKTNFGLEITIVPKSIKSREEAIKVYRELGVPLRK